MTPSYAETLRPTTSESTAATPASEPPLGITSAPALNGNPIGERVELARYTVPAGQRVIYGQRVNGVVRFLLGNLVLLVGSLGPAEDSTCRSRTTIRAEGCTKAIRPERPSGASEPRCRVVGRREDRS